MRILVTGGFGFTGKYLTNHLEKLGHDVRSMRSDITKLYELEAELSQFQPNSVVHLAGISSVLHKNVDDFYLINLIGTSNLLSSIEKCCKDISSIILASTAHVYGNNKNGALDERCPIEPGNDYAVSKYAMELMANLWKKRLPIVITRPFNYTGVGQSTNFLIPKIVEHYKQKTCEIHLGNTHLFREFGDVRDVVDIYRKIIETPPLGETINICAGEYHRLTDIIDMCEKISGHVLDVKVNPDFVRQGEPEKLYGDKSKLSNLMLDIKPRGIEATLSWMLNDI